MLQAWYNQLLIRYCQFVLIILTALLKPIITFSIQIILPIVKPYIFERVTYAQYCHSRFNIESTLIKYCEFVLIILTALLIPIIAFSIQIIFAIVKPHIFDGPSYAQYFSSQLRLDQHPFIRYCEFLLIILTAWLTDTHCFFLLHPNQLCHSLINYIWWGNLWTQNHNCCVHVMIKDLSGSIWVSDWFGCFIDDNRYFFTIQADRLSQILTVGTWSTQLSACDNQRLIR